MTLNELHPDLARQLIDDSHDSSVDAIYFGEQDGPWVATTTVRDVGIAFYTDGTSTSRAWYGPPGAALEKAHELVIEQLEHLIRLQRETPEDVDTDAYELGFDYDSSDEQRIDPNKLLQQVLG